MKNLEQESFNQVPRAKAEECFSTAFHEQNTAALNEKNYSTFITETPSLQDFSGNKTYLVQKGFPSGTDLLMAMNDHDDVRKQTPIPEEYEAGQKVRDGNKREIGKNLASRDIDNPELSADIAVAFPHALGLSDPKVPARESLSERISSIAAQAFGEGEAAAATEMAAGLVAGNMDQLQQAVKNHRNEFSEAALLLGTALRPSSTIVRPGADPSGNPTLLVHPAAKEGEIVQGIKIDKDGKAFTVDITVKDGEFEEVLGSQKEANLKAEVRLIKMGEKAAADVNNHILWEHEGLRMLPPTLDANGVSRDQVAQMMKKAEPGSREYFAMRAVLSNFEKIAGSDGKISENDKDQQREILSERFVMASIADGTLTNEEKLRICNMLYGQFRSTEQAAKFAERINSRSRDAKVSFSEIRADHRGDTDIRMYVQRKDMVVADVDIPCQRTRGR